MNLMKYLSFSGICAAFLAVVPSAQAAVTVEEQDKQIQETLAQMDSLSEYASSTTRGKDDVPVSMSGDLTIRLKDHDFFKYSPLFTQDKARTWVDGNLDLVLGVYPNSFVNLWTILQMPFDFSGWYSNQKAVEPSLAGNPLNIPERVPYHHHIDVYGPSIWEELTAGIDLRSSDFGGMFKLGGVLWAHSSPLTMWERETYPRFPSVFETFEEERTVSTYYKEKMFRPVKEGGRAFWTNRSFGGVMLDIYRMPFDMTGQILLAQPKDADIGTRDGMRLLAGQPGDAEMKGSLDFRGDVFSARIAKEKIGDGITVGANYLQMDFDNGLIYEKEFQSSALRNSNGIQVPHIVNSKVASLDMKGNLNPLLFLAVDLAMALDDSVKFRADSARSPMFTENDYVENMSSPSFAAYAKVQSKHWIPITAEMIFVPKTFYSPYGMTDYSRNRTWRKDEAYLGAGTFRYSPNLAGINLKFEPEFNRGRFDVQYGLHRQVEEGLDVLAFNHRLNGRLEWESLSSWSKYNSALPIDSGTSSNTDMRYDARVGATGSRLKLDDQQGGLRGGTWETWEVFVPYNSAQAIISGNIPVSAKWSMVLAADMAYDIGSWIGYSKNVMLHLNTALYGISRSFAPLAYSEKQKDMLLWSWFAQSEPSIAITPTFHMLGILGFEIFRAEKAYKTLNVVRLSGTTARNDYELAPINFLETALGLGFDWDFTPRAGLHVRYRYATHTDETMPQNNWKAHFVTAETKVWF